MLFEPPPPLSPDAAAQLSKYSQSMHEFTLRQWTESRRQAAEAARRTSNSSNGSSGSNKERRARVAEALRRSGTDSDGTSSSSDDELPTVRRRSGAGSALDDALRREARQYHQTRRHPC